MATGTRYFIYASSSSGIINVLTSPVREASVAINATATAITFGTAFPSAVSSNYTVGGYVVGSDGERVRFVDSTMISSKAVTGFTITSGLAGTLTYWAVYES